MREEGGVGREDGGGGGKADWSSPSPEPDQRACWSGSGGNCCWREARRRALRFARAEVFGGKTDSKEPRSLSA